MSDLMSIRANGQRVWRSLGRKPENPWNDGKKAASNFLETPCFFRERSKAASKIDKMLKGKTQDFLR